MKRIALVGMVGLVAAVAVVGVVLWSPWSAGQESKTASVADQGASEAGGTGVPVGIKGIIEYTVRDASGNVKTEGVIHNTVNTQAINEVLYRMLDIATTQGSGDYDGIAALSVAVGTDDPSDGVLAASITDTLDGSGSDCTTSHNPNDGTFTDGTGSESGNGTIAVTFTACANGLTVAQIVLTNAAPDNNNTTGGSAIADAAIFAYVDVPDVNLNSGDTVQYTWTVDVD